MMDDTTAAVVALKRSDNRRNTIPRKNISSQIGVKIQNEMICTINCKTVGVAIVPSVCCKNINANSSMDGNTIKITVATNSIANIPSTFIISVVLIYFAQRRAVILFVIDCPFNFMRNVSMLNHTYSTSETFSSSTKNIVFVSLYGTVPVNTELTIVAIMKNTTNFHILKLRTFAPVNPITRFLFDNLSFIIYPYYYFYYL